MRLSPTTRGLRLAMLLWLLPGGAALVAGDEAESDATRPLETISAQAGAPGPLPDVFLLPDEQGNLRRVVGAKYEELMRAWTGRPDAAVGVPPRAVIEQLQGAANIFEAEARVQLQVVVRKTSGGQLRVPLLMPGLILEEIQLTPEEGVLAVESSGGGYALWLWGDRGARSTLELKGRTLVDRRADASRWKLSVPSAVSQRLEILFERPVNLLHSTPGVRPLPASDEAGVALEAVGGVSPIEVEWTQPQTSDATAPAVLNAESLVRVEVQTDRVRCAADIRTKTPASADRRIRVRLPEGFRAAEGNADQHETGPGVLELTPVEDDDAGRRRYRLVCEAPLPGASVSASLPITAFEVLGAYTQRGRVEVSSTDRLRVFCEQTGNIQQVPLDRPEADAGGTQPVGAYDFGGADWSLKLHTDPVRRVVRVRPEFDLRIAAGYAELTAEFDYRMTGPGDSLLRVALNQWKLVDAPSASGDALDVSRCYESSSGIYVMHLRSPATTSTRVTLKLRRDTQGDRRQFSLPLPEPVGGSTLPGSMTVDADPALALSPVSQGMVGLSSLAKIDRDEGGLANGAFYYRTFSREVAFATRVSQRPVRLDIDLQTSIDIENGAAAVTQRYDCAVQYGQEREIALLVPQALIDRGVALEIREGELWRPIDVAAPDAATEDGSDGRGDPVAVRLRLDEPLEGLSEFGLRYRWAIDLTGQPDSVAWSVPLCAAQANSVARRVTIRTPQGYACNLAAGRYASSWSRSPSGTAEAAASFSSSGDPWAIPFSVSPTGQTTDSSVAVEKAWLQSWVVGRVQQDRQRFRLRAESELLLSLPSVTVGLPIEVLLDGRRVEPQPDENQGLRVTLPGEPGRTDAADGERTHTLEVRWLRPLNGRTPGLAPVQISGVDAAYPVVWELMLPSGKVLAGVPEGFAASMASPRRPGSQAANRDTAAEIGEWMAWPDSEAAPWTGPRYVMVSLEPPGETSIVVFNRAWVILLVSLGFFATLALAGSLAARSRVALVTTAMAALAVCCAVWPLLSLPLALGVFAGGSAAGAATFLRRYSALAQDASGASPRAATADSATHSWTGAHPTSAQSHSGVDVSARSSA
ncbi:MAG: hypothetical protein AAGA92_01000 [Planctomycetota bacterium]